MAVATTPSLDDASQDALSAGSFIKVPMSDRDIGAELLPSVSNDLYTDPLHTIREYTQNAVDGHASEVTIKLVGRSLVIVDNGDGMDFSELRNARQIGVSGKDFQTNVGFRGI